MAAADSRWKPCLIKFPPELLARIDVDAELVDVSRSEWVRRACNWFLDEIPQSAVQEDQALSPEAAEIHAGLRRLQALREQVVVPQLGRVIPMVRPDASSAPGDESA